MHREDFDLCQRYADLLVYRFASKADSLAVNVGTGVGSASSIALKLGPQQLSPLVVFRVVNRDTADLMKSVIHGSVTAYIEQFDPKKQLPQSVMREALKDQSAVSDWIERAFGALYVRDGVVAEEPIFVTDGTSTVKEDITAQALDFLDMDEEEPLTEIPVLDGDLTGSGPSGSQVDPDIAKGMTDEEAAQLACDLSLDEAADDGLESLWDSMEFDGGTSGSKAVRRAWDTSAVIIEQGDITQCFSDEGDTSAIVNAANVTLLGGGGVDGAIHKAAGPELLAECQNLPLKPGTQEVRCRTGEAVVTAGHNLPADYIIHSVGPIFEGGVARRIAYEGERPVDTEQGKNLLTQAIANCFFLAESHDIRRIAFPAISCGVFGCPIWLFAEAFKSATEAADWDIDEIRIVMFKDSEFADMQRCWKNLHAGVQ